MDQQKYILGFDTAMGACTVGLYDMARKICIAKTCEEMNRGQAERLIPMIEETLHKGGAGYAELAAVGCTRGPGAFTGLRLSLATAKALSYSLSIPALGVTTLKAVAHTQKNTDINTNLPLFVCLETKRKDYYIQIFDGHLNPLSEPQSATIQDMETILHTREQWIVCGDGLKRLKQERIEANSISIDNFISSPSADSICSLLYLKYNTDNSTEELSPLYLRAPDVSFPKK